jgi:hypothetical protein
MSYIVLSLIILLIMWSTLWSPGGILLLDFIFTDHMRATLYQPLGILFPNILSQMIWYEMASKVFFLIVLCISAYLGILIAKYISERYDFPKKYSSFLEILSWVFFLINPFAYERMMVQPTIYLGVIALGYGIYFLYMRERYILAWVAFGISLACFPHASFMIVLIYFLYLVFFVRSWKAFSRIWVLALMTIILNLNWLVSPFFGVENSASSISSFGLKNFEAFQTQALAPMDVISTNALLYWFWWERYGNHYARVDILSSLWYIAGFLLIGIMILWLTILFRAWKKRQVWTMSILAIISIILGIGMASPLTAPFTLWLTEHIPLFAWYREPQKWIWLLMMIEGIALVIGMGYLLEKYGYDIIMRIIIFLSLILLMFIWSPGPTLSYHGQLQTTVYPSWFESLRTDLIQDTFSGKILSLPWHSYMGCKWTGRPTISNPIQWLLSPIRVVSSDNIEVGDILYSNSRDPQSQAIEAFLSSHIFSPLSSYGFTHVLLMRDCANSDSYLWLDSIESCKLQRQDDALKLYACQK